MEPLMQTEQIDNYLLGKMSDTERAAFEQQLAADAALRQKTALQREIINAIREQEVTNQQVVEVDQFSAHLTQLTGNGRENTKNV